MNIETNYNAFLSMSPKANEVLKENNLKDIDEKKLREASQSFEAEFLKMLLKAMDKAIPRTQTGVEAPGKETIRELMIEQFAEHMASSSPLGVSQIVYDNVKKTQDSK